jgi:hypothetical protein
VPRGRALGRMLEGFALISIAHRPYDTTRACGSCVEKERLVKGRDSRRGPLTRDSFSPTEPSLRFFPSFSPSSTNISGSPLKLHFQAGASVGASNNSTRRSEVTAKEEEEAAADGGSGTGSRGRRSKVREKPGRLSEVMNEPAMALCAWSSVCTGQVHVSRETCDFLDQSEMNGVAHRRTMIRFRFSHSAASFATMLNSTSGNPPRLLTRRMTSSWPSFLNGR